MRQVLSPSTSLKGGDAVKKPGFDLYIPLVKRAEERLHGAKVRLIYGIASTPDTDLQGQRIRQEGINFQPLLDSGFFNWNHYERPETFLVSRLMPGLSRRKTANSALRLSGCSMKVSRMQMIFGVSCKQ